MPSRQCLIQIHLNRSMLGTRHLSDPASCAPAEGGRLDMGVPRSFSWVPRWDDDAEALSGLRAGELQNVLGFRALEDSKHCKKHRRAFLEENVKGPTVDQRSMSRKLASDLG